MTEKELVEKIDIVIEYYLVTEKEKESYNDRVIFSDREKDSY